MTAEIAILNKEAIAMAADSAVTFQDEEDQKIFTSANKIFTLSKYYPVGIMVYGAATFMDVPWETIIKTYRNNIGNKSLDTVKNYAEDFISFFCEQNDLFSKVKQQEYVQNSIFSYFNYMKEQILKEVEDLYRSGEKPTDDKIREITSKTIQQDHNRWTNAGLETKISKSNLNKLKDEIGVIVAKARKEIFEKLPITTKLNNLLQKIAENLFLKFPEGVTRTNLSGIVIAGFGSKEIFPSLISFLFDGIACNHLKFKIDSEHKIDFESDAAIIPFAQSEMVATFITGIHPDYQIAITKDMFKILDEYPSVIVDHITKLSEIEKERQKKKFKEISNKKFEEYSKALDNYKRENYVNPILKIVSFLPKSDLAAAMAESLVNLTSFKRKVSPDAETVGGPIDVAVISKGDGFIWIKRKHYFKADLNPQFFENYYRRTRNEE